MQKLATFVLLFSVFPLTAFAGPPTVGVDYQFQDPAFGSVVVCGELDQLQRIVDADNPTEVYGLPCDAERAQ